MKSLAGIFQHEYRMMIGRLGPWVAYAVIFLFNGLTVIRVGDPSSSPFAGSGPWPAAGEILYVLNLFAPLIAGIASADRLIRDDRLGVRELQRSAPPSFGLRLAGKYAGVLAASLTPVLLFVLGTASWAVASGIQPAAFFPAVLAGFAAITLPAFAFVVAFSLACPLLIPVRIYQVLLTGYWFWGNYLNPDAFPTLNGTLLTPAGIFALHGFFKGRVGPGPDTVHTAGEACVNILILAAAIFAVLALATLLMSRREREA
ncbi:MAG: hypothetical protein JW843_12885 [Candidatus Aminicenantes bacterium]|nr:hypothetical protein [Candidatus Aminicenantes bacterium]